MERFVLRVLAAAVSTFGMDVRAHEDPRGDVHPSVITASGRFEVYFSSNNEPGKPIYRTIFSADGKLIVNRELFRGKVPESESFSFFMDVVEGRPSFSFTPLGERQSYTYKPKLPPGTYADCKVVGWLSNTKIIMRDSPARPRNDKTWPFSLRIVDLPSGDVLHSATIGTPGRIYDFASTSSALSADSDIIIAWMEEKDFTPDGSDVRNAAYRLVVTRWQPKLRRTLHTVAARSIDDNVSIDIQRINNVLLVAWHELGTIRFRTIDLEASPFAPRLPVLRLDSEAEKKVFHEIKGF